MANSFQDNIVSDLREGSISNSANGMNRSTSSHNGFHLQSSSSDVQIGVFDFHRFRKVSTVWATITMITIHIFLLAAVLPLNWYCTYTQKCHISAFSIAVYLNVGTAMLTLVLQQYIQCQNEMIRRHGYGVYYRLSAKYMRAPFVIFSFGNILMLVYQSVLRDVDCMFQVCSMSYTIQYAVLQILVGLEVLSTLPFLFVYLARTIKFNALEQTPDVFRDNPLAQDTVSYRRVIGIRDQTLPEETLERQSDQIYYLQTRCEHLTRELYEVVAQLDCLRPSEDLQMSGHEADDRLIEA